MTEIVLGIGLLTAIVLVLAITVMGARSILSPSRPASLTVNGSSKFDTRTGVKLLAALNDNGILVPSACAGAGTCGLCRVKILKGGAAPLPTEAARLTKADLRDQVHLACQVVLRGDMEVEVDNDLMSAENFTCTVESVRALTPLIREIVLHQPDGMKAAIEAGSFVQITAPAFKLGFADIEVPQEHAAVWQNLLRLEVSSADPVTRAYSVSNRPEDTDAGRIVLNIRLALPPPSVPEAMPGVVSSWLFSLKPGDQVDTSGPFGSFRAQPGEAEMVFIGGGVGMAPLRAIIFDQLERLGSKRRISYWYGARNKSDLPYQDEFAALAARHPNFDWTVALSDPRPEDDWQGATGFVHMVAWENYLRDHPAPEACEYYLCGPPMMIRAVSAMLDDAGVDKSHIFSDDFGV
ncbi:NADH:ubiquinone oxidoreductase, Na(+)-translocating, F subunit [Hoeflea sp. IMCC20628]|uniref:NADH:ubiquinone reductase (Na(+)-transporting) subunit F n=1 Tax=Hoeflea sp. IMCC20628 TaxID=1620421 RepID=UPI00063ABBFC|nr:NADH:ubiquinone reductase (Na(+)-transporting) subunit F [Hoeflea sp. IMCC20628]AKH98997.1 NADH:ubiquinone oxidoreductase, Na(+)-translocating, F subunit [Hoeflea sp. IMCC20628]